MRKYIVGLKEEVMIGWCGEGNPSQFITGQQGQHVDQ